MRHAMTPVRLNWRTVVTAHVGSQNQRRNMIRVKGGPLLWVLQQVLGRAGSRLSHSNGAMKGENEIKR